MNSIKWIFVYIKEYKFKFLIALLTVILYALISMIGPYLTGVLVDERIINNNKEIVIPILLIIIASTIIKSIVRYLYKITFEHISHGVIFKLRDDMYNKLQELELDYYNRTRTGDIMARMTGDMDAIRHFIAWVIYNILENLIIFIFAIVTMFFINIQFTLLIITLTPVVIE